MVEALVLVPFVAIISDIEVRSKYAIRQYLQLTQDQ